MDIAEGRPISFSTEDGLTLEGTLHLPDPSLHPSPMTRDPLPGIVVCHPHPQYGGDMRSNVVAILCGAAVANGITALRFNFRGVGDSEGAFDNGIGEQRDVVAALAHLRSLPEIDPERTALAGYSFGAAMALRAADREVRALIAVSTPTVSGAISQIDVECPLLFVSGDRDEYSDPDALATFVESAGPHAELIIVPGVDHFWWGSNDRLATILSAFLTRTLVTAGRPA